MTSWLTQKRICVTGGVGFLGTFVVNRLQVACYQNIFVAHHRDYDLVRREDVDKLYRDAQPEILIHLAAVGGGIGANRENPARFFYENLMMGAQLLEGARLHGVEKIVTVGTVCSYPKHTSVPFREEDLWDGYPEETNAAYGIAKKALLVQAQAYRQQYGLNCLHLLLTNLYGVGDDFNPASSHVIPALIRKCLEASERGEQSVEVWGTGEATRDFLYVEDAAEALLLATERYNDADPVNIGSGREISIRELARLIAEATGFGGNFIWDASKPDGQPRRCLDTTKAESLFGFHARTDFREGLRRTVEWYRQSRGQGAGDRGQEP